MSCSTLGLITPPSAPRSPRGLKSAARYTKAKNPLALVGLLLLLPSCDAIIIGPTTVTVSLVNTSEYSVEAKIFIHDEQDIPEALLTELGDELNFTIPAGETQTFTRLCEDLQAIVIEDADLLVLVGLGPEANSDVLRDGHDFRCGSRIIFTFSHSDDILDFDVTALVQ